MSSQCPKCYHKTADSRLVMLHNFDATIRPNQVVKNQDGIRIEWPDGHQSQFKSEWLRARAFRGNEKTRDLINWGGPNTKVECPYQNL